MRSGEAARAATLYLDAAHRRDIGRPFERVLGHVARMHDALSSKPDVDALIDELMATDARRHLFALQGLARIYRDSADDAGKKATRGIEKVLARTKELEDALGAYGYALDVQKWIAGKQVPRAARAMLDDHAQAARRALTAVLEDGWLPEDGTARRLEKIVGAFATLAAEGHLSNEETDARELRRALARLCASIADKKLDMTNLEGGLHELRRQLRWVPITMMALDGLVRLDPAHDPLPRYAALKSDPIADTPFGKLPVSPHEHVAINVSQSLFLQLSKTIGELGKLKDRGQLIHGLAQALEESAAATKKTAVREAERLLGDVDGMAQVSADAKRLQRRLASDELLKTLARNLD